MKYYVAYDERKWGKITSNGIIAIHDTKKVIKKYIEGTRNRYYKIGRCDEKELEKIVNFEDLYLVRFSNTYVQVKFYHMIKDDHRQILQDFKECSDVLERILRCDDISIQDRKHVKKTILLLAEMIETEKSSIPDYEELKNMKSWYEECQYDMNKLDPEE